MTLVGALSASAGAILVWGPRLGVAPILQRLTLQSRLVCGLSCLGLGYHLIIWSLADSSRWLHVPRERWWLVLVVAFVAVGASLASDRLPTRRAE
ncbi:MAG: hypothetical protein DYG92_13270 [Leptolyngbya sp. PLA1]|nr:hypothetical protein [Leptolyngbya sp. PLA1]